MATILTSASLARSLRRSDRSPRKLPRHGYQLVIVDRRDDWNGWMPRQLDSLPPSFRKPEALPRYGATVAKLYAELLQLNQQFIANGTNRWAMIVDPTDPIRPRHITPFDFRVLMICVERDWKPKYLLDVPPFAWDALDDGESKDTLAEAVADVAFSNRSMTCHEWQAEHWHVVIAVEHEAIIDDSRSVSDFGAGLSGICTRHISERFHIVDDQWPLDDCNCDLSTHAGDECDEADDESEEETEVDDEPASVEGGSDASPQTECGAGAIFQSGDSINIAFNDAEQAREFDAESVDMIIGDGGNVVPVYLLPTAEAELIHESSDVDLAQSFADEFNRLELATPTGFWAVAGPLPSLAVAAELVS